MYFGTRLVSAGSPPASLSEENDVLTREALKDGGWLQRFQDVAEGSIRIQTEEELARCRARILEGHPAGEDLWLFGYGSLIWNPAFHYAERCLGRIHGYHRRFCLWTHLGRGSVDRPGLMLGLDNGGSCTGVFFRLTPEQISEELPLVWRREMITAAYEPRWVVGLCAERRVRAVTFIINHDHERYARKLDPDVMAEAIARAEGPLGRCSEYLFNTTDHLRELGVRDRSLEQLYRRVREIHASYAAA